MQLTIIFSILFAHRFIKHLLVHPTCSRYLEERKYQCSTLFTVLGLLSDYIIYYSVQHSHITLLLKWWFLVIIYVHFIKCLHNIKNSHNLYLFFVQFLYCQLESYFTVYIQAYNMPGNNTHTHTQDTGTHTHTIVRTSDRVESSPANSMTDNVT